MRLKGPAATGEQSMERSGAGEEEDGRLVYGNEDCGRCFQKV